MLAHGSQVPALAALQAAAGNQAVVALLRERAPPALRGLARQPTTTGRTATLADLDAALAHSDVDEDHVIEVLGRLSRADQARVLTGGYRDALASALNTGEMVRAVQALHAPLWQALEWVQAAAGSWKKVDYPDIGSLVRLAPQAERDVLKTRAWRGRFVDICSNATMVEAVIDLRFDLVTKLDWSVDEGMNAEQAATIVRSAPAAELPLVLANATLMAGLKDELSASGYETVLRMLRFGVLGESDIEREYVGNTYHTWTTLYRSELSMFKLVTYDFDTSITAAERARFRQEVQDGVARHLNGKWKLRVTSAGGAREGDGDYPIKFEVREGAALGYRIHVHAGNGRSATGEAGANWYVNDLVGTPPDERLATWAHELAHATLGAPEEYAVDPGSTYDPGRTVTSDYSIMSAYTKRADVARFEIKDRHLSFLALWASRWFPGRLIRIVR